MRNGCKCDFKNDSNLCDDISNEISLITKKKAKKSNPSLAVLKPFIKFVESLRDSDLYLIRDTKFVPISSEITIAYDDLDDEHIPTVMLQGPSYSNSLFHWPNGVKNFTFDANYIYYGFGEPYAWSEEKDPKDKFYILENNNGQYSKRFFDSDRSLFEDFKKKINKRKATLYGKNYESIYKHSDGTQSEFSIQAFIWNGGIGKCCASIERYKKCEIETNLAICKKGPATSWGSADKINFICQSCYEDQKAVKFKDW